MPGRDGRRDGTVTERDGNSRRELLAWRDGTVLSGGKYYFDGKGRSFTVGEVFIDGTGWDNGEQKTVELPFRPVPVTVLPPLPSR